MFADDVKIWSAIRTDADNNSLQEDLNSLSRYSKMASKAQFKQMQGYAHWS